MPVIPILIYGLCLATSVTCAALLVRGYRATRTSFLLFSAICFGCLALNNLLVVLDMVVLPELDLARYRLASALVGVGILIVGFVWNSE